MTDVDIYLDVDGVLNACCIDEPEAWGWGKSEVVQVNGFQIRYSPTAVQRLNDLAERPDVQVHWLTTWEHDAATLLSPQIGLNGKDWPVLINAGRLPDYSWWKLHALRKHFEASAHRAVWIDDDLADRQARNWAKPYVDTGRLLLLVQPRTEQALTLEDFDSIEAWIGRDHAQDRP